MKRYSLIVLLATSLSIASINAQDIDCRGSSFTLKGQITPECSPSGDVQMCDCTGGNIFCQAVTIRTCDINSQCSNGHCLSINGAELPNPDCLGASLTWIGQITTTCTNGMQYQCNCADSNGGSNLICQPRNTKICKQGCFGTHCNITTDPTKSIALSLDYNVMILLIDIAILVVLAF